MKSVEPEMRVSRRPAIPGIPTPYKGVLFRSRLEARWASFFDAMGWPWIYEHADLFYYIPDFVLTFPAGDVVVEVKPETRLADLRPHALRAVKAGWDGEVLAVGARIFDHGIIGLSAEPDGPEHITGAARPFRCINCGSASFLNEDHGWHCRSCGCYEGNGHVGDLSVAEITTAWNASGNRVQWRPGT
jgi:hypothetical protein